MLKSYRHFRHIGCTRRDSVRLVLLLARLTFNDPPTDTWGRSATSGEVDLRSTDT
jgi:hypothetical protein